MRRALVSVVLCLIAAACGTSGASGSVVSSPADRTPAAVGVGGETAKFALLSTAFDHDGHIPEHYTCDGKDFSPQLRWGAPPDGTASLALIMDDPDAPRGTFVHWLIWNIAANTRPCEEAMPVAATLPDGSRQGENGARVVGYRGPCPPGTSEHRYFFKLYALDTMLTLPSGANKQQLLDAMQGHILGQGELVGRYSRPAR